MHPQQQREVIFLLALIAASTLLGSLFGMALLFVALVLFAYVVFMMRNTFSLHDWLLDRSKDLPDSRGFWGEIFNEIYITEKEKQISRNKLKDALTRFQDAATAFPDGTLILSSRNEIEWANPTACLLLGIELPDDMGQKINNLIRNPAFHSHLLKGIYHETLQFPSPENPFKTLSLQVIPFGSNQKLILCRDITHLIKLEEMRSAFISNVSHELRSPLTVVSGYLEMFTDVDSASDIKPERFRSAVDNMYQQTQRMERLVSDLLALSRLETEATRHDETVDVPAILTALRESAEMLGKEKKQSIILDMDEKLRISGSRDELHSLFSNLIYNAVHYTPDNGTIEISWQRQYSKAVFSVKDNGPGIAAQHIPHLTERFYRVDADRSRETGGTGLGLAIVKHIVERHDAELNITSRLGQGSTFSCIFPEKSLR